MLASLAGRLAVPQPIDQVLGTSKKYSELCDGEPSDEDGGSICQDGRSTCCNEARSEGHVGNLRSCGFPRIYIVIPEAESVVFVKLEDGITSVAIVEHTNDIEGAPVVVDPADILVDETIVGITGVLIER